MQHIISIRFVQILRGGMTLDKKLFMIGNAHLDPVWLWRWQDGYEAARATFRSVLDRMEEYPDFVFTSAAMCCYEWIEHSDPDMFREIQARVKEGRWKMVGGWWIQADCNIPSGEGFARQALLGQGYLREKFGVTARTGYNVDSFGHSGSLPKILRMCGMDRYVYMRPGIHERAYPAWTFRWQSPEGDEVTAFRIPYEYCTWPDAIEAHIDRCASEISDENGMMCFYGVGNHGGGPTRKNIDSIHALDGHGGVSLKLSDPDAYFDQVTGELPIVNGDLLHHASGCYAAHSGIKRWNRQAENALLTAEKWSTAARILFGGRDQRGELKKAWKKVLFNQFHDILAGTAIQEAYEDARQDLGYALSAADAVANEALQTIARHVEVPFVEGAQPYIVFNPHAYEAEEPVQIEMADRKGEFVLLDSEGRQVPWQKATASAAANGRAKLCFIARVPAMGWARYILTPVPCETPEAVPIPAPEDQTPVLENDLVRVCFDPASGEIASIVMKETGEELMRLPSQTLIFADDSDTWSHAKLHFTGEPEPLETVSVRIVADGEVFRTLRVTQVRGMSRIIRDYTLYRTQPQVRVRVRVDWRETQKCLKFAYPLKLNYMHVRAQAPFGYADREMDGEEYPMHEWVDVSGCTSGMETRPSGLAILNDGKYAYDTHGRTLYFTVLRSPYYANHEPKTVEPDSDEYPVVDQGMQEFNMVLYPHTGGQAMDLLDRRAALLNAPMTILPEYAHGGSLAAAGSLACAEGTVMLDAMKLAEDGTDDVVLHLHETARQETEARLRLPLLNKEVDLRFAPGQIRALRISPDTGAVQPIDLIERAISEKNM